MKVAKEHFQGIISNRFTDFFCCGLALITSVLISLLVAISCLGHCYEYYRFF